MASVANKRRSTRQAATRKRSRYAEPDTDDSFDESEVGVEENYASRINSTQATQIPARKKVKRTRKLHHKPQTRSRTTETSKSKSTRSNRTTIKSFGSVRKANVQHESSSKTFKGPSDNKSPRWTSLPIAILRDIFIYASQPLHEATITASSNAAWLLRAARTCRMFAEPALEAYYRSPALHTSLQPHHLLELLQIPKDKRTFDYNVKIQALTIDVRYLAYTAPHRPLFPLSTLVTEIPQLHHLEISHPHDDPPFRVSGRLQSWYYPKDLFSALENSGHRLQSWKWGREMISLPDPTMMYAFMASVHTGRSFETVQRLVLRGFNFIDSAEPHAEEGSAEVPLGLAKSIALLPNLRDLTFISCDIVEKKFLLDLPLTVERLELTNCLEVHSDMILEYLKTSGAQLRELVLNSNISLNWAFLSGLKSACSKLEVLKMDLRYYSEKDNSNDARPLYDSLLTITDVPTWPTTMRHLELVHPQKLPKDGAENLFRSLIDAAEELPDLRYIVLQAHINDVSWRDRIPFREEWVGRLERVFLRKSQPPSSYMGSLRQFRLWKQEALPAADVSASKYASSLDEPLMTRRMIQVAISPAESSSHVNDGYHALVNPPRRRSLRVAENHNGLTSASGTPGPDSDSDEETADTDDDWRTHTEKYIQGLCDVVDVRIDNQRPRENQFTEKDFLDEEVSGDEDWNENADEIEDGYAW
nr:hypothetical protein CFP56_64145 [Quercus suber]